MPQIELCLVSSAKMAQIAQIEEVAQTLRFMMPRIELKYLIARDGQTVRFTCESADTLTLSSAVVMLKQLLRPLGELT